MIRPSAVLRDREGFTALARFTLLLLQRGRVAEDLLEDPHLEAVDFFQMSEHPTEGTLRLMRQPVRFSATPASIYRHPPTLGEHTREVLAEFGLDQAACVGTGAGND